jgi:RNA polymerase sigma factor (sigma-70 family)
VGLCYRMTGNAADADDLVQETFVRAWKSPPERTEEPWRPWLARVAMNLSRDLLRRRKRRHYDGTWLPSPIETGDEAAAPPDEPVDEQGDPLARYDMLESVSFAFLLALEALTPAQRAVLLLRDVFDYSVKFNGMPARVMELKDPPQKYAPRIVTACELDEAGNIRRIFNILATRKLTAT